MLRHTFTFALAAALLGSAVSAEPRHAIAMHGEPKHPATMPAFPYVNPAAPKGGRLSQGILGTYDSLNPLVVKGESAAGIRGYVYESLLVRSEDEPFTLYGLIAESIEVSDDRRTATFTLRENARFSDGKPVTVDDVLFSYRLLKEKGWPGQRNSLSQIAAIERPAERQMRFVFKPDDDGSINRELPLIIGLMAILPAHAVDHATFEQTTLTPPIGSGPYTVARVDPGRVLIFKRNPDWWAKDLPLARGRFNFDEIRHEYFRDATALFEAFKTGALDVYEEADPVRWAGNYDIPAVREGRILKREFSTRLPAGMSALVFNTRRPPFDDIRVRRAMTLLFDATWINRNLYAGMFKRTESYFERSDLSSASRPADDKERALLASFPDAVTPEIMNGTGKLPESDGSGNLRKEQRAALALLAEVGYRLDGQRLVHAQTGKPLSFEWLANSRGQERLANTYARVLNQVGITLTFKLAESSQYEFRLKDSNFDMIQTIWASSLSPGVEQIGRFGSSSADRVGSRNYAGVKSPAADAMIRALLSARDRDDFASAVRALDRVLRSGSYVIPLFHLPRNWVAHAATLKAPEASEINAGYNLDLWWRAPG